MIHRPITRESAPIRTSFIDEPFTSELTVLSYLCNLLSRQRHDYTMWRGNRGHELDDVDPCYMVQSEWWKTPGYASLTVVKLRGRDAEFPQAVLPESRVFQRNVIPQFQNCLTFFVVFQEKLNESRCCRSFCALPFGYFKSAHTKGYVECLDSFPQDHGH